MTTIVTRSGKGSSLSWSEVDTNFTNLNTDKAETDSPTFTGTVSGITKEMIGLGNVDNTSDVNKPISTATQTSLDLKVPKDSDTGAATLPAGTTAQRPSTGVGKVRFNSTIGMYEGYNTATSSWESLGSIVNTQTVGISGTASENHFWDGSVPNQLSLKRGTPEAPGAVVLSVNAGETSFPSGKLTNSGVAVATAVIDGSAGTLLRGKGIASINRSATGVFVITLNNTYPDNFFTISAMADNGALFQIGFGNSTTTTVQVNTYVAGVPTNPTRLHVSVHYLEP